MADRRRRRPRDDGGEDEGSVERVGDGPAKPKRNECESEGEAVSEYESASEDKATQDDGSEEEETDSEEETETETEDDEEEDTEGYEDDSVIIEDDGSSWVEEERQSGDGQEQQDDKNLDDDEDRKNPAYIPRRGAFYEHDTRMGSGGGEGSEKEKEEEELRPKKNLWKDQDKWLHDRYRDDQQAPKSRDELIAIYGYDIRAHDKPPENAPKRGGMGPKRGRRGQRRLGDFVPSSSPRSKTDYDNRSTYSDMANENENRTPYDRQDSYSSRDSYSSDNRRDNRGHERAKNYRNQSQDYRNQETRSHDVRQDYRSQDYRNQDYGKYSRESQDYRSDTRQDYRGRSDYDNQYPEFSPRNTDGPRSRGRGRGRGRGGRGRFADSEPAYAQSRPRQSTSPREFTNSAYREPSPEVGEIREIDTTVSEVREKSQNQDVVISNKENVQTISVTITNTTTEKKSYSKDRRNKASGRTRVPDTVVDTKDPGAEYQSKKPEESYSQASQPAPSKQPLPRIPASSGKADMAQSRPKRYSSQRQRNVPDSNYSDQMPGDGNTYYNPDAPAYTPPYQPVAAAAPPQPSPPRHPQQQQQAPRHPQQQQQPQPPRHPQQQPPQTILQPPMGYPLPVSTAGLPNAPPRLFAPGPAPAVTMTAPSAIIQPPFLAANVPGVPQVVYGAPPGTYPIPHPVGVAGFPTPSPPTQPVPMPQQVPQTSTPPAQSGTGQELFRGGTTYYAPELQQPSPNRSPLKRPKAAIPIVDPTHQRGGKHPEEIVELPEYVSSIGEKGDSEQDTLTEMSESPVDETGDGGSQFLDDGHAESTPHYVGDGKMVVEDVKPASNYAEPVQEVEQESSNMASVEEVEQESSNLASVQEVVQESSNLASVQEVVQESSNLASVQEVVPDSSNIDPVQEENSGSNIEEPVQQVESSSDNIEPVQSEDASNEETVDHVDSSNVNIVQEDECASVQSTNDTENVVVESKVAEQHQAETTLPDGKPHEETVPDVEVTNTKDFQLEQTMENIDTTEIAQSNTLESESKNEPDSQKLELVEELSKVSIKDPDELAKQIKQESDPVDDLRMKPQIVQEFCVRKDIEVADIKPVVTELDSISSSDGAEYGGSKQVKQIEQQSKLDESEENITKLESATS